MSHRVVILASSLTRIRRKVNGALISFTRDWQSKNISVSYKYWLEDWQYLSGILYLLSHHHRDTLMSVAISQTQKQRYRITLDIEVLEDFNPHNIDWENLFELEGNEKVIDSYVEDMSNPVSW